MRPLALLIIALLALGQAARAADMVAIPAGPFTMGSDDGPSDERPAHLVNVPAFEIDRFPVTNREYAAFLQASGLVGRDGRKRYDDDDGDARIHRREGAWQADPGFEEHPVNEVPWQGAVDYCASRGARLPTEAEWEKAARGTDRRPYPWGGAAPEPSRARYAAGWNATAPATAHPAGASPYGVREMAGNLWNWVSSGYRPYPYRQEDGREDGAIAMVRGTRGGGHDSPAAGITTTQRGRALSRAPQAGHHNIGFRCAR